MEETETGSLFSKADIEERENRRRLIAKAELETSQAEKELQEWYRLRHSSRPTPDFPQSPSSQAISMRYREVVSESTSPQGIDTALRLRAESDGKPPRPRHEPNLKMFPDPLSNISSGGRSETGAHSPSPHSEIEFKPPPEDPLKSLSFSRELGAKATIYSRQPSDYRILVAESDPVKHLRAEFESQTQCRTNSRNLKHPGSNCQHLQCIPWDEHERLLRQKSIEWQQQFEQQRIAMLDALNKKVKDFERNMQIDYRHKSDSVPRKSDEERGVIPARVLSEQLRKHLEEQLAGEADKSLRQSKEIARLEKLLSERTEDESKLCGELRLRVEALSREVEEKKTIIHTMSEAAAKHEAEIEALIRARTKLEAENSALSQEIRVMQINAKDDQIAQTSIQSLEHELSVLKQEYAELLKTHRRTVQDMKEGSFEVHLKPSSPLKKKFDSPEGNSMEARDVAEIRRQYERKCLDLSEEALLWKEKSRKLASKHFHALQKLQRDSQQLRNDLANLGSQTLQQIRDLGAIFEERILEKDRLTEQKMPRHLSRSSEKVVTAYISKKY